MRQSGSVERTAASDESVERELRQLFSRWRRSAMLESSVPVAIGLAIIPGIYFGLWFCAHSLLKLGTHGQILLAGPFHPVTLAIGGAWLLLGTIVAWRHVSPLSKPVPPPGRSHDPLVDPPLARLDRGELELSPSDSVLRAESLVALVASGPRNLLEGLAAWRDVPKVSDAAYARAAQLLTQAARPDGLTARTLQRDGLSAEAMGVLWRLKLIRKDGTFVERWRIRTTTLGSDVAAA